VPAGSAPPAGMTTTGRRRTPSPSDAPTGIAFTPGPQTLTPSDESHTVAQARAGSKKGKGALVAVGVVVAVLGGLGAFAAVMATRSSSAPRDASVGAT